MQSDDTAGPTSVKTSFDIGLKLRPGFRINPYTELQLIFGLNNLRWESQVRSADFFTSASTNTFLLGFSYGVGLSGRLAKNFALSLEFNIVTYYGAPTLLERSVLPHHPSRFQSFRLNTHSVTLGFTYFFLCRPEKSHS